MWCELPHHVDDKYLSRIGAEHSILLAPSSAFNPDAIPNRPAMRMNIAYVSDARFHRFMTDRRDPSWLLRARKQGKRDGLPIAASFWHRSIGHPLTIRALFRSAALGSRTRRNQSSDLCLTRYESQAVCSRK